ncbi:MAG: hypothetical protein HUK21_02420 [Fibrobacteraceae bacterium]|nr:hypothetical protein [Fibrobacteraceae bacterium]
MIYTSLFTKLLLSLTCFVVLSMATTLDKYYGMPSATHISFVDSAQNHEINIRAQLVDSVAITNLETAPTHYDNSMSVRLFLDGHFTDKFIFDARVKVSTDYTNREIADHFYNPNEGIPYNKQSENKRTWDLFAAKASYNLNAVKLLGGFDYIEWGPARRNHVILRGEHSPYRPWQDSSSRILAPAPTPYFGYQFELGPITYSQYGIKLFERKGYEKYMHAHHLNLRLPAQISLGLSETSLYGTTTEDTPNPNLDADSCGREFEWAYMIPFIPYVFEEHLMGDQDNISLSFDLSIKTIPGWELYAELLWDDMKSPTSMFDDSWWGNKWATTLGIARDHLKLGEATLDWFAEYTRIEPWVYTHHKGGGYTYASYSQSMGSDLGPGSQEFHTELSTQIGVIQTTLIAGAVAKDTAFSNHISDIHTPESPTDKKFLNSETTLRYTELGGILGITPWSWISLRAGYTRFWGDYQGYRASATGSLQW